MTARHRPWLLPLVWLAGYLVAWGTILVDRQMIITSQAALVRELASTKVQLQLQEIVEEFDGDWQQMVDWNKQAILPPPKEVGK